MKPTSIRAKLGVLRRRAVILLHRRRLGVHVWIPNQPYSELLYSEFLGTLKPQPMTLLEELDAFTRLTSKDRVLWIHSEASYSWGREGPLLDQSYRSFLGSLERWSRKKGRLVWTIHDDGLHLNDPDPHRIQTIRTKLREMAECFHVHSEAAKRVAIDSFGAPADKVIVVPCPTYAPIYLGLAGRPKRAEQLVRAAKRNLLSFGNVKAYKNYDALAESLEKLGSGSFARLTIAGMVSGNVELPEESYRRNLELDLRLRFVDEEEIAPLFNDAHFLVLPYTESLTSAAAALSMGFGIPVIAPDLGGMRESVPKENWPLIYPADDPEGLTKALQNARDMSVAEYEALEQSCLSFGKDIYPARISARLIQSLSERGII